MFCSIGLCGSQWSYFGRKRLSMMIVLFILAIIVIAGSILADYRWRKWMAERRRDRDSLP